MSLGVGEEFAGYTVIRRLGAGGMGEVYLAQHPRLPRRDALKLLTGDITTDSKFRERFLREADLASTLWHPHIVGVHDRGEVGDRLWISMDFVDGEDAASLLVRKYPAGMPAGLALAIIKAVASALDYAHKNGLLHRDIKPSNILISHVEDYEEPRILLTDFGIARTVEDNSGLTDTNMTIGTVDYAAPEQLMGVEIDSRADQYSLAATAYHLFTGVPLFCDSKVAVVIGRHLNAEPPRLADVRPELASLDHVLAAALAKNPEGRFATCGEFVRALEEHLPGSAVLRAAAAATAQAPIKRSDRQTERTPPPEPLPPGWYPDPSGKGGTLYWDGRGWLTAPLPRQEQPDVGAAGSAPERRSGLWLVVAGIGAVTVLTVVILAFLARNDSAPQKPDAQTTSYPEPTFPSEQRPRTNVSAPPPTATPPTHTATVTVTPPPSLLPAPPPPAVPYWAATIVGTCDEGGSCGVKQRVAPYRDAEARYPNALKDGTVVQVACQTTGDSQTSGGTPSYYWYRLVNGAYVNVVYTNLRPPMDMPEC